MNRFAVIFLPALIYQTLAIIAGLNHLRRRYLFARQPKTSFRPAVSVLKPLRGLDPNTFEAFISQASQNYPEFELLFGVADNADPVIPEVRRLQAIFPEVPIRLLIGSEPLANGKAGVLANLARHARYSIWVINDSDIKVTDRYLPEIITPLSKPSISLVTCLYRARAHSLSALWEALGIATDFMPSTLVAQLIGVREFGLGSTLAFHSADLERVGGFEAIGDYLADDYQLAKRVTGFGKRAWLSTYTVETSLGDTSWRGGFQHQLRWARTIRASKGGGYAGLPITHTGIWILVALASGFKAIGFTLLAVRLLTALLSSWLVLESLQSASIFWLAPVLDLYSFAVWLASYAGREVRWRDRVMSIDRQGRILRK